LDTFFRLWLKDKFNLHGDVKSNMLQESGGKVDNSLKDAIKTWLNNQ